MTQHTFRIIVSGRVQGVGYRAFVKEEAQKLHLKGFVKNTSEGNVLIEVTGDQRQIDHLMTACKKGPLLSKVKEVNLINIDPVYYDSFEISF